MRKFNLNPIVNVLEKSSKIAFFHHIDPDGDALGSSYALLKVLQSKYPLKKLVILGDKEFISRKFKYLNIDFSVFATELNGDGWTTIVGDASSHDRIYKSSEFDKGAIKICVDHHTTKLDFQVDYLWQDGSVPASSIQTWMIAQHFETSLESMTAIVFLHGIITDTGWFAFSLNDPTPLKVSKDLMRFINESDLSAVYSQMRRQTFSSIKLEKFVLNNYVIKHNAAYCIFRKKDLLRLNFKPDECSNVNRLANIENIKIWGFFIEDYIEKKLKISLRSNSISVEEFASKFGGGGHKKAAGLKMDFSESNLNRIINEFCEYSR